MAVSELQLDLPLTGLANYCRRNNIVELALFGSALRDDFDASSDIDLLVTFAPEAGKSLMDRVRMEQELTALLGRPVDLVSKRGIEQSPNWIRRGEILGTAQIIYAAR